MAGWRQLGKEVSGVAGLNYWFSHTHVLRCHHGKRLAHADGVSVDWEYVES